MSTAYPTAALIIKALVSGQPFSFSGTYLAAFNSTPDNSGDPGTNEVTGAGYQRMPLTFGVPSNGSATAGPITFPIATGPWGTIDGLAICDKITGGQWLVYGIISSAIINNNQVLNIPIVRLQIA